MCHLVLHMRSLYVKVRLDYVICSADMSVYTCRKST
jgi:hypothetical protein